MNQDRMVVESALFGAEHLEVAEAGCRFVGGGGRILLLAVPDRVDAGY